MEQIGLYKQLTPFTSEGAGTAEWCKAEKDGRLYFIKKFLSPVYPSADLGLPEKKFQARVEKFHRAEEARKALYSALKENDTSGVLVLPEVVMSYQFHICAIVPFIDSNITPSMVCQLSKWQRLVLMRTLTLALMSVHRAGVVHGDMKPENVLITQKPDTGSCFLKLIDFDGSFFASDPPGDIVGDPSYYPPEAYAMASSPNIRLDHRIDVFALGIIFHYYWCGKLPDKPVDQTVGECLLRGGAVTLDASIPPALHQLIQKMIAADPNDRPSLKSVYDMLGDQIKLFPPHMVNLQPERKAEPPSSPEQNTGNQDVPESGTVHTPYETESFRRLSPEKTEITEGVTAASAISLIKKGKIGGSRSGKKKWKKLIIALFVLFLLYWMIMYLLSMDAYGDHRFRDAKRYMDLAPFFSTIFQSTYDENERMLSLGENDWNLNNADGLHRVYSATSTPKPALTATPRPTATPKKATATPKPTATPTPNPTAAPTATPRPTATPKKATATPKPTATPTPKPTAAPTAMSPAISAWTCSICKAENPFDDIFCTNCGQTKLCLECGYSSPKNNKFCTNCGTEIGKWKCWQCGELQSKEDRFCVNCGTKRHTPGIE